MKQTSRLAINTIYIASTVLLLLGCYQMLSRDEGGAALTAGCLFFVTAALLDDDVRKVFRRRSAGRSDANPNK